MSSATLYAMPRVHLKEVIDGPHGEHRVVVSAPVLLIGQQRERARPTERP
jgi:hypothetical protein